MYKSLPSLDYDSKRWLYLYEISDPGNLGTLLRSAAWFNIKNIALSKNSADPLNPKVVRSAVGARGSAKSRRMAIRFNKTGAGCWLGSNLARTLLSF